MPALTRHVRAAQPNSVGLSIYVARPVQDKAETIRSMCIGISAHQKLDLLSSLVRLCGYESVAVFGDCFDEVVLLDPVQYPGGEPGQFGSSGTTAGVS